MIRIVVIVCATFAGLGAALAQQSPTAPAPSASAGPPACNAEREGTLLCQAGRSCNCAFRAAEPARGLPGRWAWDCDIKRPACNIEPAAQGASDIVTPGAVIIDRRKRDGRKDDSGG